MTAVSADPYVKVKQRSLECPICMDTFNRPKVLPCQHSFCSECIDGTRTPGSSFITCAICRKSVNLPAGGAEDLPNSLILASLIDEAGSAPEDQDSGHGGGIKITERFCHIHTTVTADHFCFTCGLTPCGNCSIQEHNGHNCVILADARGQCKNEVQGMLPDISEVEESCKSIISHAEKAEKRISTETEVLKSRLNRDARAIRNRLDDEEEICKAEVDDIFQHRRRRFAEFKEEANQKERHAHQINDAIKQAIEDRSDDDLLTMFPTFKKKVTELKMTRPPQIDGMLTKPPKYFPTLQSPNLLGTVAEKEVTQAVLHKEIGSEGDGDDEFRSSHGIAVFPSGDLVIADAVKSDVRIFSSDGQYKLTLNSPDGCDVGNFNKPVDVTILPNGHIAVVDQTRFVKIFDLKGKFVSRFSTLQSHEDPNTNSILQCVRVFKPDGKQHLMVADYTRKVLVVTDLHGQHVNKIPISVHPYSLAINSQNLAIVSSTSGKVVVVNFEGRELIVLSTLVEGNPVRATGVCCDSSDSIYVALHVGTRGTSLIYQYSRNGKFIGCVTGGLMNPLNITFTPNGKLAVADTHSVKIYSVQ